jgi:phosphoglycerol transferase
LLHRRYNRIGVFLGFFALAAAARLMQPWAAGWGGGRPLQGLGYGLLGAVLVLGILDQAPPCLIPVPDWVSPDRTVVAEQFRNDREFVATLEAVASPGAMICQMPYMNFPESIPYHGLGPYDQLRPYLHSKRLRWSFGAMQGRETDLWRRSVEALPMPAKLAALRQAGFSGVLVNRLAFTDDGRQLEGELGRLLDAAPLVSRDHKLAYFSLDCDSSRSATTSTVAAAPP